MLKLRGILRSSAILGSDSPESNDRKDNSLWVTTFIPRERPNGKHAIASYLRLPQPGQKVLLLAIIPVPQGGRKKRKITLDQFLGKLLRVTK